MKNIVLVIDWQNTYFKNRVSRKYMHGAVEKTVDIIKQARKNNDTVCWIGIACNTDTLFIDDPKEPKAIHPALLAVHAPDDPCFIKRESDSFTNPPFDNWMMGQDFDHLIFTGFHIHDCVRRTLVSAVNRGYGPQIILPRDACGDEPASDMLLKSCQGDYFNQIHQLHGGTVCATERLLRYMRGEGPLRQIPYNDVPRWHEDNPIACEFNRAFNEILRPLDVLDRYVRVRTYVRDDDELLSHLEKKVSPAFMKMWARANKIDQGVIDTLTDNPDQPELVESIKNQIRERWNSKPSPV